MHKFVVIAVVVVGAAFSALFNECERMFFVLHFERKSNSMN